MFWYIDLGDSKVNCSSFFQAFQKECCHWNLICKKCASKNNQSSLCGALMAAPSTSSGSWSWKKYERPGLMQEGVTVLWQYCVGTRTWSYHSSSLLFSTLLSNRESPQDEIEEIKAAFDLFDVDGTQRIHPRDLRLCIQSLNLRRNQARWRAVRIGTKEVQHHEPFLSPLGLEVPFYRFDVFWYSVFSKSSTQGISLFSCCRSKASPNVKRLDDVGGLPADTCCI